jgi:hypothetical protein
VRALPDRYDVRAWQLHVYARRVAVAVADAVRPADTRALAAADSFTDSVSFTDSSTVTRAAPLLFAGKGTRP